MSKGKNEASSSVFRFNKEQDTLEEVFAEKLPEEEKDGDRDKDRKKDLPQRNLTKDAKSVSVDDVSSMENSLSVSPSPGTWRLFKRVQQAVEDIKTNRSVKDEDSDKDDISEGSVKDGQEDSSESSSFLNKIKNRKRAVLNKLKKDSGSPYKVSPAKSSTIKEDEEKPNEEELDNKLDIEDGVELLEDMVLVQPTPEEILPIIQSTPRPQTPPTPPPSRVWQLLWDLVQKEAFVFAVLAAIVTLVLRLSAFWQGAFVSAFVMLAYKNLCEALKASALAPKRVPPSTIPIEEHKSIKTYVGWMNQVGSYNPEFYHVTDTQSVFVSLEGSTLRLAYTKSKISKRHLWNDKTRSKVPFVSEKLYNLRGATIEIWPRGLARKRYYSRKYPIKITFALSDSPVRSKDSFDDESSDKTDSQVSTRALDTDLSENGHDDAFKDCEEDSRTIIYLFARCDREKEDWLRRFTAASHGDIYDCNEQPIAFKCDDESKSSSPSGSPVKSVPRDEMDKRNSSVEEEFIRIGARDFGSIDHIISPCASRTSSDFVNFVMAYVKKDPSEVPKKAPNTDSPDECPKALNSDVFWTNLAIGRVLYGIIHDSSILDEIHTFLQKKLSAIKLPNFMEEVNIAEINLGNTPPLIHKIHSPSLDERGLWIDADLTYEGLVSATISTKLNLMRLKKQEGSVPINIPTNGSHTPDKVSRQYSKSAPETIYDSDAESTGESSSESEDETSSVTESITAEASPSQAPNKKRLLRIVNKITTSNLFQSATEISYIQRAMENMSTNLKLRVELKGLTARVVVNLPSPPSDRVWLGFREPPQIQFSAKPTVGETLFDWSIVTSTIENKLVDEISKYLVYPNLIDVIMPILGQPTYRE